LWISLMIHGTLLDQFILARHRPKHAKNTNS
jgi:hypothetical protein